jgi:hypothetical protein
LVTSLLKSLLPSSLLNLLLNFLTSPKSLLLLGLLKLQWGWVMSLASLLLCLVSLLLGELLSLLMLL